MCVHTRRQCVEERSVPAIDISVHGRNPSLQKQVGLWGVSYLAVLTGRKGKKNLRAGKGGSPHSAYTGENFESQLMDDRKERWKRGR